MLNIKGSESCLNLFNDMKLKKTAKFMIFKIEKFGNTEKIVVSCMGVPKELDLEGECSDFRQVLIEGDEYRETYIAELKRSGIFIFSCEITKTKIIHSLTHSCYPCARARARSFACTLSHYFYV